MGHTQYGISQRTLFREIFMAAFEEIIYASSISFRYVGLDKLKIVSLLFLHML